MNKIDRRIVEMSFENAKFEKGIEQSKGSLKEFSNALDKMGTGKEFSGLDKSIKSLSSSFSALEQVAVGALRQIGAMAVNVGASLLKSLTVDQLSAGLDKYQQKIEAVQTMVSAGYDLSEVEKSMEQIMWFSDETSYSFSDMAGNMSKFIAAGVDLKTSERAMQGIATWAAHSGKNSQSASIAMFNLAQAISMGYVDTLNWRSVMMQNMNTTMFKQVAIGVAEATGAIQKGQVTIENFDANLKTKWFTNDVLLKTLEQYSVYAEKVREVQEEMGFSTAKQAMDYMSLAENAEKYADVLNTIGNAAFKSSQESKSFMDSINATMDAVSSGWLRTYEYIFGTLDEAKAKFSALTDMLYTIFAASGDARNEMLAWLKEEGGIDNMFQGLKNIAIALLSILHPISQAFDQIFPPKTKEQWLNMTQIFADFTQKLIIGDEVANNIRRTFAGLFAAIDIGWQIVKFLGEAILTVVKVFFPFSDSILSATASLGDFLVEVDKAIKESTFFQYALLAIQIAAVVLRTIIISAVGSIISFVEALWTADDPLKFIGDMASKVFDSLVNSIKMVVDWLSQNLPKPLANVLNWFRTFVSNIITFLKGGFKSFTDFFKNLNLSSITSGFKSFGETIKNLDFSKITKFVVAGVLLIFVVQISKLIGAASGLVKALKNLANGFGGLFEKAKPNVLRDLALVIGVLAASIWVLSTIPADKLKTSLSTLGKALLGFVGVYLAIQAINIGSGLLTKKLGLQDIKAQTLNLIGIAASLGILVIALKTISEIDQSTIWNSTLVIMALLGLLTAYQLVSTLLLKISPTLEKGSQKAATSMLSMSVGLLGLIGVLKILSMMSAETLANGLIKLSGILAIYTIFNVLFSVAAKLSGGNKLATSILSTAVGLAAMLAVFKLLEFLDIATILESAKKLTAIVLVIGIFQLLLGLAARLSGGNKLATSVLSMSVSLLILIGIIKLIEGIDDASLKKGLNTITKLTRMILVIEILTAVTAKIANGQKVQRILGSVTITMLAFTALIKLISFIPDKDIGRSLLVLTAMAGIIIGIEVLSSLSTRLSKGFSSFGNLLGVSIALIAITGALTLLSVIDEASLKKATNALTTVTLTISALLVGLGILVNILDKAMSFSFKLSKEILVIGGLITAIIGLAAVVMLIGKIESPNVLQATLVITTLSLVFLAIATMIPNLMKVYSFGDILPGILTTGGIVTALIGLAAVVMLIGKIESSNVEQVMLVIGTLGLTFIAIAGILPHLTKIHSFKDILPNIITTGIIVTALAGLATGVIWLLSKLQPLYDTSDYSLIITFGAALAALIVVFGIISLLGPHLGKVPLSAFKGIIVAIGGVVLVIAAVGLLMAALGGLSKINGFTDLMKDGGEALIEIAVTIGGFIGALYGSVISKFTTSITSALPEIGAHLAGFFENLSGVDTSSIEILGQIAGVFALIAIDTFVDSLTSFSLAMNPFIEAKTSMGLFVLQLKEFVEGIKEISVDNIGSAKTVLIALEPLMPYLKSVATGANAVPSTGGVAGFFAGENNIDIFGQQLATFINIMSGSDENAITVTKVNTALTIVKAIVPIMKPLKSVATGANTVPNTGGVAGFFAGNNDIDTFGQQVATFINIMGGSDENKITYSKVIAVLDVVEPLEDVMWYMQFVAKYANAVPNTGGVAGFFAGNNDIDKFGEQLIKFIEIMGGSDDPNRITPEKVTKALDVVTVLEDLTWDLQSVATDIKDFKFSKNDKIITFANNVVEFVNKLNGVENWQNVTIALTKIAEIKNSFDVIGEKVLENASASFTKNKDPYITSIVSILTELSTKLDTEKVNIIAIVNDTFTSMQTKGESYKNTFTGIGKNLVIGLKEGINDKVEKKSLLDTATEIFKSIIDTATTIFDTGSPSRVFNKIGGWLSLGLAQGIKMEAPMAVNAGMQMAKDVEEGVRDVTGVHSLSDIWTEIGAWITKSFGGGMTSVKDWLLKTAKDLGIDTSKFTIEGIKEGLGDKLGIGSLTQGIEDLLDQLQKTIETSSTPVDIGNNIGTTIGDNVVEGLADSLTDSTNIAKIKSALENLQDYIDEEKFYGRISLYEELEAYQTIQSTYVEGSEERKKIDREIYTLQKTIYEAQMTYIESVSNAQKKAAQDRLAAEKQYNDEVAKANANLTQKLAEYQKQYNDDTVKAHNEAYEKQKAADAEYSKSYNDVLKKAEDERIKAREDYASKQKDINKNLLKDIEAQNKAYEDAVKSRADAIYSSYGLFDEVTPDAEITGEQLLENLRDQGAALSEWQQSLDALKARGVGDALIEELQQMGPSSKAQIKALLTLTDSQLNEYVKLFQGKYAFARVKAETELVNLKASTQKNIQDLVTQAAVDLQQLEVEFSTTMSNIDIQCQTDLQELQQTYSDKLTEINTDLQEKLAEYQRIFEENSAQVRADTELRLAELKQTYDDKLTEINDTLNEQLKTLKETFDKTMKNVKEKSTEELDELNKVFKEKIDQLNEGVDIQLDTLEDSFDTTLGNIITNSSSQMDQLVQEVKTASTGFYDAGLNAAQSFASGLNDGQWYAVLAAQALAQAAVNAAYQTLYIRSPSRVFMEIGRFVSEGFAQGITDYSSIATKSTESMANKIIGVMSNALSLLEENNDEFAPTITPIVDLSIAKQQMRTANDLFNSSYSYKIAQESSKLANSIKDNQNGSSETQTTITNNFNISELSVRSNADIDEIAQKLYNKQQTAMRGRGLKVPAH